MALARSLKMRWTNQGETNSTTFAHANPAVEAATLDSAMKQLNGLTRNTYLDTYVIDTQSLNEMVATENVNAGSGI